MNKPVDTLARLRSRSQEAGRFVLPLNRAWADKLQAAYTALNQAEILSGPDNPESGKRIAEAQAEVDRIAAEAGEEVVVFRFRRLGRAQYDALVSRNPPSAEQKKEDEDKPPRERRIWNQDTFGPDLVHAVMFDPKLPYDEVVNLINGPELSVHDDKYDEANTSLLSKAESETLLNTAIMAALNNPRSLPADFELP